MRDMWLGPQEKGCGWHLAGTEDRVGRREVADAISEKGRGWYQLDLGTVLVSPGKRCRWHLARHWNVTGVTQEGRGWQPARPGDSSGVSSP